MSQRVCPCPLLSFSHAVLGIFACVACVQGLVTHFKGGAKAKLGDYWLSTERNIEDALAFTRPKTGTIGEGTHVDVVVVVVLGGDGGVVVGVVSRALGKSRR